MKHGHTIITLFALVSLGTLTLWAVRDLWVALLGISAVIAAFIMLDKKAKK